MKKIAVLIGLLSIFFLVCEKEDDSAKPNTPFPENGATNQELSLTLSWQCENASSFDVHFATYQPSDGNSYAHASDISDAQLYVSNLDFSTTYYWQVKAKFQNGEETTSDIWTFVTKDNSEEEEEEEESSYYNITRKLFETECPARVNIMFQVTNNLGIGVEDLTTDDFVVYEDDESVSPTETGMDVDKMDKIQDELNSSSFLVKANLAPANFLDFYGIVGAADLQLDDGDFKGVLAPAWGVGIRPAVFPSFWNVDSDFNIALDGQYLTWSTEDNDIEAVYHEVQGALVLAYVYKRNTPFIVPYGGFKYDFVLVEFEGVKNDLRGDIDYAISVGCDYFVTKEVFFNVDLTIFSETRIFAAVGYKY